MAQKGGERPGGGAIPRLDPDGTRADERTRPRARAPAVPVGPVGAVPDQTEPRARPARKASSGGVVPQGSYRGPTRTQKVLSNLQREWKYSLAAMVVSLGLLALALYLGNGGHPFLAALAALLIIPVLFFALFVKRAPCPVCGTPLLLVGIEQCAHCGEYIRVDRDRLKPVEVGYIAENPTFLLDVPLPVVPRLFFPEGTCAVCGAPVAAEEELEVQGTRIVIPHCADHQGGVVWSLGVVSAAVPTVSFRFRSFDYWKAVRERNAAHVRAGMWR